MPDEPVAHTALGDLRGVFTDGIAEFRGVPYAAPPLGELRFASALPVPAWNGQRVATRHGPIAPQLPSRLGVAMGNFFQTPPRGLPDPDHLHAGARRQGATGARLAAWRRLDLRRRLPRLVRWIASGARRRYRICRRELSTGRAGLAAPAGHRGHRGRHLRHDRGARLGARPHRWLRRRSGVRDRDGPVGRRHLDRPATDAAGRAQPVPARHHAKRWIRSRRLYLPRWQRNGPTSCCVCSTLIRMHVTL
jgi:Carboxylesterase family